MLIPAPTNSDPADNQVADHNMRDCNNSDHELIEHERNALGFTMGTLSSMTSSEDLLSSPDLFASGSPNAANEGGAKVKTILLSQDLEDWLTFTRWNDVKYRDDRLDYNRTLRAVQEKRAAIQAQEEKLRQFQHKYGNDHEPAGLETIRDSIEPIKNNNSWTPSAARDGETRDTPFVGRDKSVERGHVKTLHDDTLDYAGWGHAGISGLRPGADLYATPPAKLTYDHAQVRGRSRSRDLATPTRTTTHKRNYRDDRGTVPKHIDLGRRGDTRFFVIRSYETANVRESQQNGLWATKHENARKLVDAFYNCNNVVLIFGVNKSHKFEGYARMTSTPSGSHFKPRWWSRITWPISQPFTIEWITKTAIDNNECRFVTNSLNENLSVVRSRDCQELDHACGTTMVEILTRESMRA